MADIEIALKKYVDKFESIRYLDFLSEEKRNVVFVGPNGCGKTTLLRKLKVYKSNYILHFDDIELVNNNIQDNIIEDGEVISNYMDIYDSINIDTMKEVIKKIKTRSESILIIKPKQT